MLPYMTNYYGNPHSRTHSYGWESEKAVEVAREVNFQELETMILKCNRI
jgi:cysteine sulfinate desulfinase/cysteine desulfurase-like protein